jgi:HSP20 family protein
MDIKKLAPWNWFKKEQEQEGKMLPIRRRESNASYSDPFLEIRQEIDRIFDNAFRGFGFPSIGFGRERNPATQSNWLKPTLDIAASDQEYSISVELPGVDEKEVQLELDNDTLKIKGDKRQEKEKKEKNYYRMERSYGSFQRTLSLPEDADQDKINAVYKKGIMEITIPRKAIPKTEVKQIEIKTSE